MSVKDNIAHVRICMRYSTRGVIIIMLGNVRLEISVFLEPENCIHGLCWRLHRHNIAYHNL